MRAPMMSMGSVEAVPWATLAVPRAATGGQLEAASQLSVFLTAAAAGGDHWVRDSVGSRTLRRFRGRRLEAAVLP